MPDHIIVNISNQCLLVYLKGTLIKKYLISSSRFGEGSEENSHKTPLGRHRITEKIGHNAPAGNIFINKAPLSCTSLILDKPLEDNLADDHVITSRILVLEGLEEGINKGEGIDSYKRCIYIHGTPFEYDIGRPASYGCIRMKNKDIIELFDMVQEGLEIKIVPNLAPPRCIF